MNKLKWLKDGWVFYFYFWRKMYEFFESLHSKKKCSEFDQIKYLIDQLYICKTLFILKPNSIWIISVIIPLKIKGSNFEGVFTKIPPHALLYNLYFLIFGNYFIPKRNKSNWNEKPNDENTARLSNLFLGFSYNVYLIGIQWKWSFINIIHYKV